jgi:hypothetical protein
LECVWGFHVLNIAQTHICVKDIIAQTSLEP